MRDIDIEGGASSTTAQVGKVNSGRARSQICSRDAPSTHSFVSIASLGTPNSELMNHRGLNLLLAASGAHRKRSR